MHPPVPLATPRRAPAPDGTAPLLLVGHGTRSTAGVAAFDRFTARVAARLQPLGVAVAGGFIELSPPPLTDAVRTLVDAGHTGLVAVPMMLVAAGHAKGDVPAALAREEERHPGLRYAYGRPLGPHPRLLEALTERLDAVLDPRERAETVVLLVGRGSTDPDANAEVYRAARLFEESSRVAGVEAAFVSLAPPGVPAALERCRLLGARRVVVVPYFLFPGVLPDRIIAQARAWAGMHPAVEVRGADVIGDCDLLADLVVERYSEALAGEIRMNCDTCVYRVAMPGFENRVGAPQTPHHHPDDPTHPHHHVHHADDDHGHHHGDHHGDHQNDHQSDHQHGSRAH
jgi:sirohydrochlorin cobaltochelatase